MGLFMRKFAIAVLALSVSACIPPGKDYSWPKNDAANETANNAPRLETDPAVLGPAPGDIVEQPTWKATPVTANAQTVTDGIYVVQPGDTLRGIANKTGAGSQVIASENGLTEPYVIQPGQRLKISGGRYHGINPGETGIAIARAYKVPWREIVALNNLEEPYILRVGQKLLLPGNASSAATATATGPGSSDNLEQRAAAFDLDIDDIVTGSQPALADGASAVEPSEGLSDWRKAITPTTTIATPANFAGRFNWPVAGKLISSFGSKGGGKVNDGLNIAVPSGTPIQAAANGVVAYAGDEIGVFGGLVLINHGDGWVTAYGHASKLNVTRGQKVKMGEVIALAGESGYVQEPQVHFEIRKNRKPVDPIGELPKRS